MRHRKGSLARQRERIVAAIKADPSRSARSIALEIGCSPSTVVNWRRTLAAEVSDGDRPDDDAQTSNAGWNNLIPGEPGNERNLRSGAFSERRVAPERERALEHLRVDYPLLSDAELATQSQRRAQMTLLDLFADERGVVKNERTGELYPTATFAEKLRIGYERREAQLIERQREREQPTPVDAEAELASIAAGDVADQDSREAWEQSRGRES